MKPCDPDAGARGPPFYIVAPRFDRTSAGSRVLHQLARELEREGHEAFICWTGARGVDVPLADAAEGAPLRHLTEALSIAHFKTGRTPVCIRPEVSAEPAPVGVDVVYALNFPGLLGGPAQLSADLVIAYSQRLGQSLPQCDGVVHLPACDPEFWTPEPGPGLRAGPEPGRERLGACVYAGKYVEQHGQALPGELASARVIARSGRAAPTPDAIREVLRTSTHLYVFENTSVVTEALLCGCPVVVRRNPFLTEMIASEEQGAWGMTEADDPASLATARAEIPRFRAQYLAGFGRARDQVRAFAAKAHALALSRTATGPAPVPRRVEFGQASPAPDLCGPVEDLDVAFAFNLFLAREVEGRDIFDAVRGRPLGAFLVDTLRSEEHRALAERLLRGVAPAPPLTVAGGLEALKAWAERRLPLSHRVRQDLRAAVNWAAVLGTLLQDAWLADAAGPSVAALSSRLLDFSRRADMRGHVDELATSVVSGWALDLNATDRPVRVAVFRGERLLVETVTGAARPDLARMAGSDGRAGFVIRTPQLAPPLDEMTVRIGAEGVSLPLPPAAPQLDRHGAVR